MPFMREYLCDAGHRIEHLHMGSRETAPRYIPCDACIQAKVQEADPDGKFLLVDWFVKLIEKVHEDGNDIRMLNTPINYVQAKLDDLAAYPTISAVLAQTVVRGNSDFVERERTRLEKRSTEHYMSKPAQDEMIANVERTVKRYNESAERGMK